jgi:hypothetical protein
LSKGTKAKHEEAAKNYIQSHIQCPNWQCGGVLYLVEPIAEGKPGYIAGNWQAVDIACDDCGTTWHNTLRDSMEQT